MVGIKEGSLRRTEAFGHSGLSFQVTSANGVVYGFARHGWLELANSVQEECCE